jgi:hypothetical protein
MKFSYYQRECAKCGLRRIEHCSEHEFQLRSPYVRKFSFAERRAATIHN